jgi:hypothetical protein
MVAPSDRIERRAMPRGALACLSLLLPLALRAAVTPPPPIAVPAAPAPAERLVRLVKLWGVVRYLHPYLAYRDLDWDAAFVAAASEVRAAKDRAEYAAAVGGMLAALGDPVTRVLPPAPAPPPVGAGGKPAPTSPRPLFRRAADGVLVVDLSPYTNATLYPDIYRRIDEVLPELPKARAVVFDLRAPPAPEVGPADTSYVLDKIADRLVGRTLAVPTERRIVHSGYQPQRGFTSGGYGSYFATSYARTYAPAASSGAAATRRAVFLIGEHAALPPLALALQAAGDGFVVSQGKLAESSVVDQLPVDLGEGLTAMVRTSELVPQPGWPGLHADVELPADEGGGAADAGLAAALRLAERGRSAPVADAPALPGPVFRLDRTYPEMLAPDLPHRLLAVARFWNVIHFFYPYLPLVGDWDAALPEMLAAMEGAEGARGYALAVAEMAVRVPDNHVTVSGHPELVKLYGTAWPAVGVRAIEGTPVVVSAGDEAKRAGIEVGDVIEEVDGEAAAARFADLARYVPASTPQGLAEKIYAFHFLGGAQGTTARLAVSGKGGRREVRLPRAAENRDFTRPAGSGEMVRILPGNVGYADLTRLPFDGVDAMFEKLSGTRALVLDMRGYPNGTAFSIGPRLDVRHAACGAQFRRREVSAINAFALDNGSFWFCQKLGKSRRPLYAGRTVMLIDERAVSQSEHSGLIFEAANGTKFVGSPTAGANGDITGTTLPGGIYVSFSGHDVRHADSRQLQRLGLVPDVPVAPTIAGIRAGRDEVLERALRYLAEGK